MAARPKATARAAPPPPRPARASASRLLPSPRSLLIGFALLAAAGGAYALARETSLFAVRTVAVSGGTPRLRAEVDRALAPALGRSLVTVDEGTVAALTARVPDLLSFRFDRAFPHTLKLSVRAERPVLLLRQGKATWLVSARGRVLRRIAHPLRSSLPRVWVGRTASVTPGRLLTAADGATAAAAVAPLARSRLPLAVRTVRVSTSEVTLVARSGFEVRLGDVGDLRLKLAVARKILELVRADAASGYLDVSVPQRPVYHA